MSYRITESVYSGAVIYTVEQECEGVWETVVIQSNHTLAKFNTYRQAADVVRRLEWTP